MTFRIVSPAPGEAGVIPGWGTKVFNEDGSEVDGVVSATIHIAANDIIRAEMTIAVNFETIDAHPMLSLQSLEEAAEMRGLKLVPKD